MSRGMLSQLECELSPVGSCVILLYHTVVVLSQGGDMEPFGTWGLAGRLRSEAETGILDPLCFWPELSASQ